MYSFDDNVVIRDNGKGSRKLKIKIDHVVNIFFLGHW